MTRGCIIINRELFYCLQRIISWLAVHSTIIDGATGGPLLYQGNCMAAVSNVYDAHRTTGVTAAIRAADGRHTTTRGKQRNK